MPGPNGKLLTGRYWISSVWVEAEPTDWSVQPHPSRNYFHRYKVRFEWVEAQGRPWWDTFGTVEASQEKAPTPESFLDVAPVGAQVAYAHGLFTPPTVALLPGGAVEPASAIQHYSPPATPPSPSLPLSSGDSSKGSWSGGSHIPEVVSTVTDRVGRQTAG